MAISCLPRDCYNSYFYVVEDDSLNVVDKFRIHGTKYIEHLTGGSALHLKSESIWARFNIGTFEGGRSGRMQLLPSIRLRTVGQSQTFFNIILESLLLIFQFLFKILFGKFIEKFLLNLNLKLYFHIQINFHLTNFYLLLKRIISLLLIPTIN